MTPNRPSAGDHYRFKQRLSHGKRSRKPRCAEAGPAQPVRIVRTSATG
jgi:hypothetical protein